MTGGGAAETTVGRGDETAGPRDVEREECFRVLFHEFHGGFTAVELGMQQHIFEKADVRFYAADSELTQRPNQAL